MKRIGILTMHRALNYGAILQCWALKTACEKLGCKVEIIDYDPWNQLSRKALKSKNPLKYIRRLFDSVSFKRFITRYLNPTNFIISHCEIMKNPPIYDIYLVGSDMIWCSKIVEEYLGSYLLDFAPINSIKIAYAPSLGGVAPSTAKKVFCKELPKFKHIAVRETSYLKELQSMSGLDITDVCDPSLLLTQKEYCNLEKKKSVPKHYILLMDLHSNELIQQVTKCVQDKLGIEIISIFFSKKDLFNQSFLTLSPNEWLYVMHNAEFIITNSYHGTAFSIIYRKPFLCCANQDYANDRMVNLLSQTGLMSQWITSLDQVDNSMNIDYSKYEANIIKYSTRSYDWLCNALQEEND